MIVLDASAAVAALIGTGPARRLVGQDQAHAPHLIDAEVASSLRRLAAVGTMTARDGGAALRAWGELGITRYPMVGLLDRVWALRETVSAYDATYVALAEILDCSLLTADYRLGRAPGIRCPVTVVPG